MVVNLTAIEDIQDVIVAFVPIMLIVSVVGWVLKTLSKTF